MMKGLSWVEAWTTIATMLRWNINCNKNMQKYMKHGIYRVISFTRLLCGGSVEWDGASKGDFEQQGIGEEVRKQVSRSLIADNLLSAESWHGMRPDDLTDGKMVPRWELRHKVQYLCVLVSKAVIALVDERPNSANPTALAQHVKKHMYRHLSNHVPAEFKAARIPTANADSQRVMEVKRWFASIGVSEHRWLVRQHVKSATDAARTAIRDYTARRATHSRSRYGISAKGVPERRMRRGRRVTRFWTTRETGIVFAGVQLHGHKWTIICKADGLEHRSAADCRLRMRQLGLAVQPFEQVLSRWRAEKNVTDLPCFRLDAADALALEHSRANKTTQKRQTVRDGTYHGQGRASRPPTRVLPARASRYRKDYRTFFADTQTDDGTNKGAADTNSDSGAADTTSDSGAADTNSDNGADPMQHGHTPGNGKDASDDNKLRDGSEAGTSCSSDESGTASTMSEPDVPSKGCKVLNYFLTGTPFVGQITQEPDPGAGIPFFHVEYSDGDSQDMNVDEVLDTAMAYNIQSKYTFREDISVTSQHTESYLRSRVYRHFDGKQVLGTVTGFCDRDGDADYVIKYANGETQDATLDFVCTRQLDPRLLHSIKRSRRRERGNTTRVHIGARTSRARQLATGGVAGNGGTSPSASPRQLAAARAGARRRQRRHGAVRDAGRHKLTQLAAETHNYANTDCDVTASPTQLPWLQDMDFAIFNVHGGGACWFESLFRMTNITWERLLQLFCSAVDDADMVHRAFACASSLSGGDTVVLRDTGVEIRDADEYRAHLQRCAIDWHSHIRRNGAQLHLDSQYIPEMCTYPLFAVGLGIDIAVVATGGTVLFRDDATATQLDCLDLLDVPCAAVFHTGSGSGQHYTGVHVRRHKTDAADIDVATYVRVTAATPPKTLAVFIQEFAAKLASDKHSLAKRVDDATCEQGQTEYHRALDPARFGPRVRKPPQPPPSLMDTMAETMTILTGGEDVEERLELGFNTPVKPSASPERSLADDQGGTRTDSDATTPPCTATQGAATPKRRSRRHKRLELPASPITCSASDDSQATQDTVLNTQVTVNADDDDDIADDSGADSNAAIDLCSSSDDGIADDSCADGSAATANTEVLDSVRRLTEADFARKGLTATQAQRSITECVMTCALQSRNCVVQSATGTGKTIAVLSPLLRLQSELPDDESFVIVVASRTHAQLKQVAHFLSELDNVPPSVVCGGRDRFEYCLCVGHISGVSNCRCIS